MNVIIMFKTSQISSIFQWYRCQMCNGIVSSIRPKTNAQKDRSEKEYRRFLKKKDIEENIKIVMDNMNRSSVKIFEFAESDYPVTTASGQKKDTTVDLPVKYSPQFYEAAWYSWWQEQGYFKPRIQNKEGDAPKRFSMVLPPPNVTGKLHLGHALTSAIEDVIVRWKSMLGNEVLWVPGSDHAGIATQVVVERHIEQELMETRQSLGKTKFNEALLKWKNEKGNDIHKQLQRLGTSLDWSRRVYTLNEGYSNAVTEAFIRLFNDGVIYRDTSCINWCCHLQSSLSDLEVETRLIDEPTSIKVPGYEYPVQFGVMYQLAYKLVRPVGGVNELIVSTTRLETVPGDEALAVHPNDTRYASLVGKRVFHPCRFGKAIPIIADEAVDKDFGTGVLKVSPAHDFTDFEIGKRHGLPIQPVINQQGMMDYNEPENAITPSKLAFSFTNGKPRFLAREAVLNSLTLRKLIRGSLPHSTLLRTCSRSGDVIEPMIKEQWFVRTREMADAALEAVANGKIKLVQNSMFIKSWENWLQKTGDWCISRQLWWGHQIPAYLCTSKETGKSTWVAARSEEDARKEVSLKMPDICGEDLSIKRDDDVLDTWFSSALYPFASLGWPNQTEDLKKFYPLDLMETGSDLIFFWVARMAMLGTKLTGQVPFRNVLFHPMVRDKYNRKMSKSVGNVIDPLHIIDGSTMKEHVADIEKFGLDLAETKMALKDFYLQTGGVVPRCGSDALRMSLLNYSTHAKGIRYSVQDAVTARKLCNKVAHAVRFVLQYHSNDPECLNQLRSMSFDSSTAHVLDIWIRSRLAMVVKSVNDSLENYHISEAFQTLRNFWRDEFSLVYLRYCYVTITNQPTGPDPQEKRVSSDMYNDYKKMSVLRNMFYVTEVALRLLSPFAPFLCEELWQRIPLMSSKTKPDSVFLSDFPTPEVHSEDINRDVEERMKCFLRFVELVRDDREMFQLPSDRTIVCVCKNEQDYSNLKEVGHLIQHAFVTCEGIEFYPYEQLEELKQYCVGKDDEESDMILLYKLSPSALESYSSKDSIKAFFNIAESKWKRNIEKLEKLAAIPEKRIRSCDTILKECENYLKKQSFQESMERVKKYHQSR